MYPFFQYKLWLVTKVTTCKTLPKRRHVYSISIIQLSIFNQYFFSTQIEAYIHYSALIVLYPSKRRLKWNLCSCNMVQSQIGHTANEGLVRIQKWNCAASLFPKQNYNFLSPNFHIHVSVSDLYIPRIGLLFCCIQIGRPILRIYTSLTNT